MRYILFSILLTILVSCSGDDKVLKFTKEEYGEKWPFSVNEIEVFCNGYKEIYCKAHNGKVYALNGSAKSASAKNPDISKVEEIWLDDPNFEGLKIPYADFITLGLKICERQ